MHTRSSILYLCSSLFYLQYTHGRDPRRDGVFRTVERREIGGKFTVDLWSPIRGTWLSPPTLLHVEPPRSALLGWATSGLVGVLVGLHSVFTWEQTQVWASASSLISRFSLQQWERWDTPFYTDYLLLLWQQPTVSPFTNETKEGEREWSVDDLQNDSIFEKRASID